MMPQEPFGILTDPERAYQDVYFILARNRYVANLCLVLFAAGGVVFLLRGLGAERLILETGHWLVHLGAGLLLLQCLPIIPMPRRYVDYPEVFYWRNLAGVVATTLCMAGTAAILLSLPAALLTRIRRA